MTKMQQNQGVNPSAQLIENHLATRVGETPTPIAAAGPCRRSRHGGGRVARAVCPPVSPTPFMLSGMATSNG